MATWVLHTASVVAKNRARAAAVRACAAPATTAPSPCGRHRAPAGTRPAPITRASGAARSITPAIENAQRDRPEPRPRPATAAPSTVRPVIASKSVTRTRRNIPAAAAIDRSARRCKSQGKLSSPSLKGKRKLQRSASAAIPVKVPRGGRPPGGKSCASRAPRQKGSPSARTTARASGTGSASPRTASTRLGSTTRATTTPQAALTATATATRNRRARLAALTRAARGRGTVAVPAGSGSRRARPERRRASPGRR